MSKVRVLFALSFALTTLFARPSAQTQTYTQLYSFTGGADGWDLGQVTLARDAKGNLYGTTLSGGDLACPDGSGYGCGVVFRLDMTGHLSVPHSFTGGAQGFVPVGLLWDGKGNLYGATLSGGPDYSCVDGDGFGCDLCSRWTRLAATWCCTTSEAGRTELRPREVVSETGPGTCTT